MANAIRRQNVATIRGLAANEAYANTVNFHYLLHEVIRQAEDQGETPKLVEIFQLLAGIPGVDINLRRNPPEAAAGMQMAMGNYGTPLELAVVKGLPQIVMFLVNHLGMSYYDNLPRVEMNLLHWSIFKNKPELFMKLLNEENIDVHAIVEERPERNALYYAIKSFNPMFAEEVMKRIDFGRMLKDSNKYNHPVVDALVARKPELAQQILQHPTMSIAMLNSLITAASTQYWPAGLRETITRLAMAEKERRIEPVRTFGEVLYRKGAEKALGPIVGEYMGVKSRRLGRLGRLRRHNRKTRRTRH
jgi:hypothetical protein